jgi:hypothetical protein
MHDASDTKQVPGYMVDVIILSLGQTLAAYDAKIRARAKAQKVEPGPGLLNSDEQLRRRMTEMTLSYLEAPDPGSGTVDPADMAAKWARQRES